MSLTTRYLLLFDSYGLLLWGVLSSDRGRVFFLYMLLDLASVVSLGSESLGTRDHILLSQIETSLFVASYDSQLHGGDIGTPLHTGLADLHYIAFARTLQKTIRLLLRSAYQAIS
jgi:hypothetical protein